MEAGRALRRAAVHYGGFVYHFKVFFYLYYWLKGKG
jgi:hypothetical protein